ncbi:hypothetical protein OHS58_17605 [Amycolatopsis sp. NBC_00348]|uniref:hypothetical protein n=1 Tax=Amycolatopsis sp. NBC_00348 TaxID=2975956 RepID=UPI002E26589B
MTIDHSAALTDRARSFLGDGILSPRWSRGVTASEVVIDNSIGEEMKEIAKRFGDELIEFDSSFGGRVVLIYGGVLEGELELGCGAGETVLRRKPDGGLFARVARHDSAQCSIVMATDGRLGCSWSDEFHPLFDSVADFIEDCTRWNLVRTWRYVAIVDADVDSLGEIPALLELEESLSGSLSSWWSGDDVAVVCHCFLNPGREPSRQVMVLTAGDARTSSLRHDLARAGCGERQFLPADIRGRVK